MRRSLRRALLATVVLTVVVWAWDATRSSGLIAIVQPVEVARSGAAVQASREPLPTTLPTVDVEDARRNPFGPPTSSASSPPAALATSPPPAPAPPVAVAPLPSPPPPTAPPPPMQWRYFGRIQTPEGLSLVMIARPGAQPVVALPGLSLSDGYRIDDVTVAAVRIGHPAHAVAVDIQIPASLAP